MKSRVSSFREASQFPGDQNRYGKQFRLPLTGGKPDTGYDVIQLWGGGVGGGRLSLKSTCVVLQTCERLCNPGSAGFMAH